MTRFSRRQMLSLTAAPVAGALLCNSTSGPTFAAAAASGPAAIANTAPKSVAAVVTIYRPFSHADVILGKILEGWDQKGGPGPSLKLASMYVEQFPSDDIAREISQKYGVPIFDSIEKAITVGGSQIPVDGVLSIGEHGDYPYSDLGQQLYPRRRFLEEIAATFEKYDRVVPVFNDKHLGPAWQDGLWMYERARQLKIPFMAGSSLPVGHRKSAETIPLGSQIDGAVGIGYSGLDVYGIHALEFLQWHLERRVGAETGVKWVQGLKGDELWKAVDSGEVRRDLLEAAFAAVPKAEGAEMRKDEQAAAFLFEFHNGLRAAQFMFQCAAGTGLALALRNRPIFTSVFDERTEPKYPHFAYLLKAIEQMIHSGKPTYPVERTLLTGGILDRALTSLHNGGERRMTPELAIQYTPVDYPFAQHVTL